MGMESSGLDFPCSMGFEFQGRSGSSFHHPAEYKHTAVGPLISRDVDVVHSVIAASTVAPYSQHALCRSLCRHCRDSPQS